MFARLASAARSADFSGGAHPVVPLPLAAALGRRFAQLGRHEPAFFEAGERGVDRARARHAGRSGCAMSFRMVGPHAPSSLVLEVQHRVQQRLFEFTEVAARHIFATVVNITTRGPTPGTDV